MANLVFKSPGMMTGTNLEGPIPAIVVKKEQDLLEYIHGIAMKCLEKSQTIAVIGATKNGKFGNIGL